MGEKMLVLSWKYHNVTFSNIISKFRDKGNYSDVTVSCEGRFYPAHKLVLAACSEYFEDMFQHTSCRHPIVVLKDITARNLEALLSYMYAGVAHISQDDLASLIHAAESLCIKGLAVPDDSMTESAKSTTSTTSATATRPGRRKQGWSTSSTASHAGNYTETEESCDKQGQCQEGGLGPEGNVRDTDGTGSHSEPPMLPTSPTHTNNGPGILECTPDIPFKSSVEDVVVKEEHPEESLDLCYDTQVDSGPGGLANTTTTDLARGVEPSLHPSQTQGYMCPQETIGEMTAAALQQQQQQQNSAEASIASSSGISQNLCEGEDCYDGFSNFDGSGFEGQMDLYTQFNLHHTPHQFHMPQVGMEGSQRGRSTKIASGRSNSGKNSSVTKKLHHCAHCSYSTPWHSVFVRHCRTHSGEKPFTCSFCPFRSSRKSVIKRHCMSKHS